MSERMQLPKAVIFDLEGTLFSSKKLSQKHCRAMIDLISESREITAFSAKSLYDCEREKLARKLGYFPTILATLDHLGVKRQESYRVIDEIDPTMYVKPDYALKQMLVQLREKWKTGILTNMSRRTTDSILSALGLHVGLFCVIVTGDIVSELKPSIEPFIMALCLLRVPSSRAVMVGDRISIDLIPARKLGIKTLLVSRRKSRTEYVDATAECILQVQRKLEILVR